MNSLVAGWPLTPSMLFPLCIAWPSVSGTYSCGFVLPLRRDRKKKSKNLCGHQFITSPRSDQVRVWVKEEGRGLCIQCAGWQTQISPYSDTVFARMLVIAVSIKASVAGPKELGRTILYITGHRDITYKISLFGQIRSYKNKLSMRNIFFSTNYLTLCPAGF